MIRVIKASVFTLLLAMSLNVNYFASAKVFESGGCRGPASNSITRENIFLTTSNNVTTFSAARVFQGCWTPTGNFPCYGIYSDNRGSYICGECDASGNPGSGGCKKISSGALANGLWCS
ncbi:MAG: hypothetical protein ACKVQW_13085 [Pyrinomonadaceae bacterium]